MRPRTAVTTEATVSTHGQSATTSTRVRKTSSGNGPRRFASVATESVFRMPQVAQIRSPSWHDLYRKCFDAICASMLPSDTVWARTTRRRATVIATTSHFPIASLDAGRTRGRIGMSFCPGRALQSSLGRVYSRDLAHDLGTIARWETRVVVTLMEEVELFELGLHALPGQLRSLGITWHLVPLAEGSVPDRSFEWRWAAILPGLAAVLVQKGRSSHSLQRWVTSNRFCRRSSSRRARLPTGGRHQSCPRCAPGSHRHC